MVDVWGRPFRPLSDRVVHADAIAKSHDASHTASTYTLPTTTGPGPSGAGRRSRHRQRHWLRLRAAGRLGAWVGRSIEGLDGVYVCKRYGGGGQRGACIHSYKRRPRPTDSITPIQSILPSRVWWRRGGDGWRRTRGMLMGMGVGRRRRQRSLPAAAAATAAGAGGAMSPLHRKEQQQRVQEGLGS